MALPTSGPISFNAINIELGLSGGATKSINDANYRTLAGIPSGLIDLQDFYGKSAISYGLIDGNVYGFAINPETAVASYTLLSTGVIQTSDGGAGDGTNWITPTSQAANYQVRVTTISGSPSYGAATNTWLALTSNRAWYLSQSGSGLNSCQFTVEIRDTATNTVRDTATITLTVEASG